MQDSYPILTFSHLRWNFVYQRPQHLLSRMARARRVIFIEEPVYDESRAPHWEFDRAETNVLVCRPHTPVSEGGFNDRQMPQLKSLLGELLEREELNDFVLWFYTPMALPLAEDLNPRAVVYDCMDELSAFLHAPPQLLEREAALLERADLVFTGGPSLYRSKKGRHPRVHCFPSSVDAPHFAGAHGQIAEAADQAALPHPRLGYFGVLDERIDLPLLARMAEAHPEWQFVTVGPVAKIDPASLPRGRNIHHFGQRAYRDLPSYLAGWDVCLMPFARNRSTEFISPTKTLEYMAAGKPIVSTPIRDVEEPYSDIVYLGGTPEEFMASCEHALAVDAAEREERRARMREVLARTSWDKTAEQMNALLHDAARAAVPFRKSMRSHRTSGSRTAAPAIVVGAGPTGLSAAYHLGESAVLLERNANVGGWCRSIYVDGFTFDYAGHIMFSAEPYVHQLYQMLLGKNVHWQDREAWIYSKGVYTRYPFQGSLYGLPPKVIQECIVGAIEARYGTLKPARKPNGKANGSCQNGAARNGIKDGVKDCCADGIIEATTPLGVPGSVAGPAEARNFEEFIYKVWGAGIAKHFAIPYNRKLWAVPLDEMETSWLGGRVPMPDLEEMIEGALSPTPKPMGPNARFGYPLRGGFQRLMDGFLPHLKGELRVNCAVVRVSPARRTVTLADGSELPYECLISTMPLPALVRQLGSEAPAEIRAAASTLRHVSVRTVHIGVGRENLTEKHWIYYPEDTVFHRIFVQGNASPYCNAAGGFGISCEITYSPHKPLPCDGEALVERCIQDCCKVGIFKPEDPILATAQCDLPYAYVVYDHGRARAVAHIREWLEERGILLAGRYSEWEYYNSDHAFIAGQKAAEKAKTMMEGGAVAAGMAAGDAEVAQTDAAD
jgi:UDP-galactopyranose mutase